MALVYLLEVSTPVLDLRALPGRELTRPRAANPVRRLCSNSSALRRRFVEELLDAVHGHDGRRGAPIVRIFGVGPVQAVARVHLRGVGREDARNGCEDRLSVDRGLMPTRELRIQRPRGGGQPSESIVDGRKDARRYAVLRRLD